MKSYPSWVENHHIKGTSIKQIGDNYYLYSVTSKYSKEKGYPISIQRYIGKITKEDGLIEPNKISFIPGKDKLVLFKDCFDLSLYSTSDINLIKDIPVINIDNRYYVGNISSKLIKIIDKHYSYSEGEIL